MATVDEMLAQAAKHYGGGAAAPAGTSAGGQTPTGNDDWKLWADSDPAINQHTPNTGHIRSTRLRPANDTPGYYDLGSVAASRNADFGLGPVFEGGTKALSGAYSAITGRDLSGDPKSRMSSAADALEGTLEAVSPFAAPGLAARPIRSAVSLGAGALAQSGAQGVANIAGADPDTSRFVGDVAGLGIGAGMHYLSNLPPPIRAGLQAGTQSAVENIPPVKWAVKPLKAGVDAYRQANVDAANQASVLPVPVKLPPLQQDAPRVPLRAPVAGEGWASPVKPLPQDAPRLPVRAPVTAQPSPAPPVKPLPQEAPSVPVRPPMVANAVPAPPLPPRPQAAPVSPIRPPMVANAVPFDNPPPQLPQDAPRPPLRPPLGSEQSAPPQPPPVSTGPLNSDLPPRTQLPQPDFEHAYPVPDSEMVPAKTLTKESAQKGARTVKARALARYLNMGGTSYEDAVTMKPDAWATAAKEAGVNPPTFDANGKSVSAELALEELKKLQAAKIAKAAQAESSLPPRITPDQLE